MINRVYLPAKLVKNIDGLTYLRVDKTLLQEYYQAIMNQDNEVDIEICITRADNKKSLPQLKYFYSTVVPIIKAGLEDLQGESISKEEVILFLKDRFFYEELADNNIVINVPLSLSKATKEEVTKFITNVINFGIDILGVHIPEATKER